MQHIDQQEPDQGQSKQRAGGNLTATQLQALAEKIYALLKDELRVERERTGRRTR